MYAQRDRALLAMTSSFLQSPVYVITAGSLLSGRGGLADVVSSAVGAAV
jgi:hypothetical protein